MQVYGTREKKRSRCVAALYGAEGWAPASGTAACPVCGASEEQRAAYPATANRETCPSGICRVCWYRFGRAAAVVANKGQAHGIETISTGGEGRNLGAVGSGGAEDVAGIADRVRQNDCLFLDY